MTEAQVAAVLGELHKLWREYVTTPPHRHNAIAVLSLRFGLMGGRPHSFEEAAELMDTSPERVREIENELLGRLARAASIV